MCSRLINQLQYSESYSGTLHQETAIEGYEYCPVCIPVFTYLHIYTYTYT